MSGERGLISYLEKKEILSNLEIKEVKLKPLPLMKNCEKKILMQLYHQEILKRADSIL